jgi:hypothetical protein
MALRGTVKSSTTSREPHRGQRSRLSKRESGNARPCVHHRAVINSLVVLSRGARTLRKFLEFAQNVGVVLHEIAHHSSIAKQLPEITIGQHEFEMVGAIRLLRDPKFAFETNRLAFHECNLLVGKTLYVLGFRGVD